MSWPDSTIIAPVTAYHRASYAERYSRFMLTAFLPWKPNASGELRAKGASVLPVSSSAVLGVVRVPRPRPGSSPPALAWQRALLMA
jgi:hypothetical protein